MNTSTEMKTSVRHVVRRTPPVARLLTELRVRELGGTRDQPEFAASVSAATSGTTAIDVGASVGNYSLALSKKVGRSGQVFALEANPTVFAELKASTFGAKNIHRMNVAASRTVGSATIYVTSSDGRSHNPLGTVEERPGAEPVAIIPTVTLDLLPITQRVSVIKIDVEGHEDSVLAGATQLISMHRPTLIVEIEQRHLTRGTIDDVVGPLMAIGYAAFGISPEALIPWSEFNVDRHQLQHLSEGAGSAQKVSSGYVNNFLFRPLAT